MVNKERNVKDKGASHNQEKQKNKENGQIMIEKNGAKNKKTPGDNTNMVM